MTLDILGTEENHIQADRLDERVEPRIRARRRFEASRLLGAIGLRCHLNPVAIGGSYRTACWVMAYPLISAPTGDAGGPARWSSEAADLLQVELRPARSSAKRSTCMGS
jgi:hypothetical protein